MKRLTIAVALALMAFAAVGPRVVRIELTPRIVNAYCKRYPKPRNLSRVTWTDMKIRQQVRDMVASVLLPPALQAARAAVIADVNEVAR